MALNDLIKEEAKVEFKKKYRTLTKNVKGKQVEFTMVSGGKIGRSILRTIAKKGLIQNRGQLESPLGKMRNRQERKAMAKSLGVPFTPRYNGSTYRKETKLVEVESKKGIKYLQTTTEVK